MSDSTLPPPHEQLIRKRIAEIPLLQAVEQRLGLKTILSRYLKPHGNEAISAVDSLMLLVFNIACGRQPLYELDTWATKLDNGLLSIDWEALTSDPLSNQPQGIFSDDRFGRVLDKLFQTDLASMITDIAVRVVQVTGVDLSQLHNDSTSVKTTGKMPGKTATGLYFARGHSKDHRPDLKQVVYSLTISADGAIPIHCKAYPGNTTDDSTHIETWNTLRHIACRSDFLYVADCTKSRRFRRSVHGQTTLPHCHPWWEGSDCDAQYLERSKDIQRTTTSKTLIQTTYLTPPHP